MSILRIMLTTLIMISATSAAIEGAFAGERRESVSPIGHELFDKGDGYLWILMHDAQNDGFQCSVSFITSTGTYSIHGPLDAEMAKANVGSLWFDSPAVPAAPEMRKVTLTVHGSEGAFNWPALQKTVDKTGHGTLIVMVKMSSMFTQKADTDNITVSLNSNVVFKANLVGLQAAYAKLNTCMAARSGH